MAQRKFKKELEFLVLFDNFIKDSIKGKRLQPNGKRLSHGTIKNYTCTLELLRKFTSEKKFYIRLRQARYLNAREIQSEANYWKKFYKRFTDFLYHDLGYYDNYIGQNIRIIKAFFNYLNKNSPLPVGNFHKCFYVVKEEIAIFPLMPEELNFLIYNMDFESTLSKRLKETKDFFVFGCTVGLRVSDLLKLKKGSVRIVNGQYYLTVKSQKTGTETIVKLPEYCIEIIIHYKRRTRGLLPHFNKSNLNHYIKLLLEKAGFTQEVIITRGKRGKVTELKKDSCKAGKYRFCDVASTHTMRRTAITTMLSLGMPEQIVRKISGHAPNSKEFFRYVTIAQTYQDQETEKMHAKLKSRELKMNLGL
jgi:integrase